MTSIQIKKIRFQEKSDHVGLLLSGTERGSKSSPCHIESSLCLLRINTLSLLLITTQLLKISITTLAGQVSSARSLT